MQQTLDFLIRVDGSSGIAELGRVRLEVRALNKEVESGGKTAADRFSASLNSIGKSMTSFGKKLSLAVTTPIAGIGTAALTMARDFNQAMSNVGSLIPGNAERLNELKAAVQSLAIETGTATDTMAEGLYTVISAFGDTTESVDLLKLHAELARAGVSTVTESIKLVEAVTKAYGDTSLEAQRKVGDLAFTAVKLGSTTFPELAASMGRVTPIAQALGVSQEELFAVMATLTGVTGSAAEVSTQLRGALQALMAPTGDMEKLIRELGFSSGETMIEQLGLQGAIEKIVETSKATGTPLQKYIGSIEGQTSALVLAGEQSDTYKRKLEAMRTASGAAKEALDAQTSGINSAGFAWEKMKVALTVAAQLIGDKIAPIIETKLLPIVMRAVDWFSSLSEGWQNTIIKISIFIGLIGPLLLLLGPLTTAIGALIPILTGPVGIAVAIGAVTAAIGSFLASSDRWGKGLRDLFGSIADRTREIWDRIKGKLESVMEALGELFESATALFDVIWTEHGENITATIKTLWNVISAIIEYALTIIVNTIEAGLKVIKGTIDIFRGIITGDWETFTDGLKTIWGAVWGLIKGIFEAAARLIVTAIKEFVNWIIDRWRRLKQDVIKEWNDLWEGTIDLVHRFIGQITDKIKGFTNDVIGFFADMYHDVVGGSYVPDMIAGIAAEFARLPRVMTEPAMAETGRVALGFAGLGDAASLHSGRMALAWEQSADAVRTGADQIIDDTARVGAAVQALPTPDPWAQAWSQGIADIGREFSEAFTGWIFEAKNFAQSIIGIFRDLAKSLLQTFIFELFGPLFRRLSEFAGYIGGKVGGFLGGLGGKLGGLFGGLGAALASVPVIGWILGGGAAGGLALWKLFSKSPSEKAASELGRDFPGFAASPKDIESFATNLGISKDTLSGIRKETNTLFALFQAFGPGATAGSQQALISALSNFQVSAAVAQNALAAGLTGRTVNQGKDVIFDLSAAAREAVESGNVAELARQLGLILGGSDRFRQALPDYQAIIDGILQVGDAANETADAIERLTSHDRTLIDVFMQTGVISDKLAERMGGLDESFRSTFAQANEDYRRLSALNEGFQSLGRSLANLLPKYDIGIDAFLRSGVISDQLAREVSQLGGDIAKFQAFGELVSAFEAATKDGFQDSFEDWIQADKQRQQIVTDLFEEVALLQADVGDKLQEAAKTFESAIDRLVEKLDDTNDALSREKPPQENIITFDINTIDATNMETTIREVIIPELNRVLELNGRGQL